MPETRGEVARVTVPIGEVAVRAARAVGDARQKRAERKAREEVQRAIEEFEQQK
jgi:hypothetical protein